MYGKQNIHKDILHKVLSPNVYADIILRKGEREAKDDKEKKKKGRSEEEMEVERIKDGSWTKQ